jgi:hypothetical protein
MIGNQFQAQGLTRLFGIDYIQTILQPYDPAGRLQTASLVGDMFVVGKHGLQHRQVERHIPNVCKRIVHHSIIVFSEANIVIISSEKRFSLVFLIISQLFF